MNTRAAMRVYAGALLLVRAVMALVLPLSADEAYYWLWSKHLDFGYFDPPPAIAWLIYPGTLVFGDTDLGVRLCGILLSIAATWPTVVTPQNAKSHNSSSSAYVS